VVDGHAYHTSIYGVLIQGLNDPLGASVLLKVTTTGRINEHQKLAGSAHQTGNVIQKIVSWKNLKKEQNCTPMWELNSTTNTTQGELSMETMQL